MKNERKRLILFWFSFCSLFGVFVFGSCFRTLAVILFQIFVIWSTLRFTKYPKSKCSCRVKLRLCVWQYVSEIWNRTRSGQFLRLTINDLWLSTSSKFGKLSYGQPYDSQSTTLTSENRKWRSSLWLYSYSLQQSRSHITTRKINRRPRCLEQRSLPYLPLTVSQCWHTFWYLLIIRRFL